MVSRAWPGTSRGKQQAVDSVAARAETLRSRTLRRVDVQAISTWLLAGGLVLYLAMDGGGYDIVVRSQVGIIVWWLVLVGAAWGVLPATRISRAGWLALALLRGLRSVDRAGRDVVAEPGSQPAEPVAGRRLPGRPAAGAGHSPRPGAAPCATPSTAIATAGALVAGFALASRLRPGSVRGRARHLLVPAGDHGRIAWPLNYWNALAALIALVLPLLLANATSGRTLLGQAAAAGAIPMVSLCGVPDLLARWRAGRRRRTDRLPGAGRGPDPEAGHAGRRRRRAARS